MYESGDWSGALSLQITDEYLPEIAGEGPNFLALTETHRLLGNKRAGACSGPE